MTPANELEAAFERLALNALRAGTGSFGGFSELPDVIPFDHPSHEHYDEALRLLRNVGRGVALQKGRADADSVWRVTNESVAKLKARRYSALLSAAVVEVLQAMCAEAKKEAQSSAKTRAA